MVKKNFLFLALALLGACAPMKPITTTPLASARTPSSEDRFTKEAEKYMMELIADKSTKKVMTCFDGLKVSRNTIDIYRTTDLNMHCVGAFKDSLDQSRVVYRKMYGCWESDLNNNPVSAFKGAKDRDLLRLIVEGNYTAMERVDIITEMNFEFNTKSRRFHGELKGIPDVMEFSRMGSCAEVDTKGNII
jgi:hypothetical protein